MWILKEKEKLEDFLRWTPSYDFTRNSVRTEEEGTSRELSSMTDLPFGGLIFCFNNQEQKIPLN